MSEANSTSRMRRLTEAATPGPWHRHTYGHRDTASQVRTIGKALRAAEAATGVPMTDLTYVHQDPEGPTIGLTGNGPKQTENAEFIAASRSFVPLALDVIEAARRYAPTTMDPEDRNYEYHVLAEALQDLDEWDKETPE